MEIYEITFLVATATCIAATAVNFIHSYITHKEFKRARLAMEILERLEYDDDDIIITYQMHGKEITRRIKATTEPNEN